MDCPPRFHTRRLGWSLACLLFPLLAAANSARALTPDQIALVVNAKEPAGVKLAEFYAKQRHIPDGRIISLDLPTGDDVGFDAYNTQVVPAVRKFLKDNDLEQKVTCLVTFYGVPLRISRRPVVPAEADELKLIDAEFKQALDKSRNAVTTAERLAKEVDPAFKPQGNNELPALPGRADEAVHAVLRALAKEKEPARRTGPFTQLLGPVEALYGPLETTQRLSRPPYSELAPKPLTAEDLRDFEAKAKQAVEDLNAALAKWDDAGQRTRARAVARDQFGTFNYLKLLLEQKVRLTTEETESAFDSELALLWWQDGYPRHRWQNNPLYIRAWTQPGGSRPGRPAPPPPPGVRPAQRTLMVMRIDGPTEQLARDLITTSVKVEKEGLKGVVALDARGKTGNDAYAAYDQTIRSLATLLKGNTKLDVVLDDAEPVFPPHSVKNVALYCGWYSLRNYVPGMDFKPGAVGFHIASSELVNLHNGAEKGWVRGLMTDGVVASLGPVAEPYLHSFPPADEFFPLLCTGRLQLAEVYWYSNPLVSWMNTCVGDPLYTPYQKNPPLKVEDVPLKLHVAFE